MRDKDGKAMLAVWKCFAGGWPYRVAARTRKEAAEILGGSPAKLVRTKGVYATGKPREL
ncbi:MAG: hypothetical protein WA003_15655 [Desulfuromonadaceae bacterium]